MYVMGDGYVMGDVCVMDDTYIHTYCKVYTCSIGLVTMAEQIGQQSVETASVWWRTNLYIESLKAGTCATCQLILFTLLCIQVLVSVVVLVLQVT